MSGNFARDVPDPWGCSRSLCKKIAHVRCQMMEAFFVHRFVAGPLICVNFRKICSDRPNL